MTEKKIKYDFTSAEVNFILNALNKVQVSGVQTAESLVHITGVLRNPVNAEEIEKTKLEELKAKYESAKK